MPMASLVLALVLLAEVASGERAPPVNLPYLKLDFYHIKTPQLIGIIAGCIVFTVTISVVIYLLYASGTLGRAIKEIAEDASGKKPTTTASAQPLSASPQFEHEPELYEHLLRARESLPAIPTVPSISGKQIQIRGLQDKDVEFLFSTCNGSPVFHESAYDPLRLWGWSENHERSKPWTSLDAFKQYLGSFAKSGCHAVVLDAEFKRPIGLITLTDNDPSNLSIRIGNVWITPAFQGTKRSHEAMFLLVKHLVDQGYRRITCEVDERHQIARRFFLRCGFLLEATLRKHRIVHNRNCNTALFVMLNSDWQSIEANLRTVLCLTDACDKVHAAALPTAVDRSQLPPYPSMEPTPPVPARKKNKKKPTSRGK